WPGSTRPHKRTHGSARVSADGTALAPVGPALCRPAELNSLTKSGQRSAPKTGLRSRNRQISRHRRQVAQAFALLEDAVLLGNRIDAGMGRLDLLQPLLPEAQLAIDGIGARPTAAGAGQGADQSALTAAIAQPGLLLLGQDLAEQ